MAPQGSISQREGELAQSGRAGVLYASGRRFRPCIPYHTDGGSISQSTPSSIGQSSGLLIRRLLVRIQRGVPSRYPNLRYLTMPKGSISQRASGVIGYSTGKTLKESLLGRGFDSRHLHHTKVVLVKDILDNTMRPPSKWELRRQKQKELRNALLLAPLILLATFCFMLGYLKLLQASGLL